MAKPCKYKEKIKRIAAGYPDQEYRWYVLLVRGRCEKKADMFLKKINIISYLPLQKNLHYWSDRKKWVEYPLFPGYLFVLVDNKDYYRVFDCPFVLNYVCFEGQPAYVSSEQIESIRSVLNSGMNYSVTTVRHRINGRVKLDCGPLTGCSGQIIDHAGKEKLLVSIDNVKYSLIVSIPLSYLVPVQ